MTVDLAKIYYAVKQRAERDREKPYGQLAELARTHAREIMDRPQIQIVDRFAKSERVWLKSRPKPLSLLAPDFYSAIRSKNFVCNFKTVNNFHTGHDPAEGWIYLIASRTRKNQVKIGYTTLELRRRLLRIRRLQEPDAQLHWARWVNHPSRLEAHLHKHFEHQRVAGNIKGDSTEWFQEDPSIVELFLSELLTSASVHWHHENLYSFDPEARKIYSL